MESPNFREASDINTLNNARVVPHNTDAEKSVLCSMLLSHDACELAAEVLRTQDFYLPMHQDVFAAMLRLYEKGHPVDVVTTLDSLETIGKLKSIGGATYLTELSIFLPASTNVSYYINIVKEHSVRRKLMRAGDQMINDSLNTEKDTQSTLNDAERRVFEIAMNKSDSSLVPICDTVSSAYAHIGDLIKLGGALSGVSTGFADLDKLTSGFQKSDLIIIAARPSMGKTAFALNIAANAALRADASVAIFSLEMSAEQLVMRMLCSEACVDMQKVKTGAVDSSDLMKISDVVGPLERSKIFIDDKGGITVPEIRSKCRRLKMRFGLDMVVIDYLQLMESTKNTESRVQAVSELTRSLKILARELDIPIIVLSQLSRATEKRKENPRPIMSDLRESGAIEQDADLIIMLYRAAVYDKSADNISEIILTKHRNGPLDTVNLAWIPEYTKFTNSTYQ